MIRIVPVFVCLQIKKLLSDPEALAAAMAVAASTQETKTEGAAEEKKEEEKKADDDSDSDSDVGGFGKQVELTCIIIIYFIYYQICLVATMTERRIIQY